MEYGHLSRNALIRKAIFLPFLFWLELFSGLFILHAFEAMVFSGPAYDRSYESRQSHLIGMESVMTMYCVLKVYRYYRVYKLVDEQ